MGGVFHLKKSRADECLVGGEIGCWEGVFHGGMVAGDGDSSQWEDVRVGGGKGVCEGTTRFFDFAALRSE